MSENYFQMKDLSVGYHGNVLIHDICTEIKKGEILTLIGPNGSGKSTILKSITKQLTLIGGKVTIGEKNLKDLSYKELATKMAVVLTQRAKPELMTCYEVVAAGRYPYTGRLGILTREDEKKTQEALEIVHATEYAEKSFEAISDGQRQRILLARAICQEPEVLILDEPTSFLDIRYKLEFMSVLQELARRKKVAVILSIHELDLAERVSDWVLCVSPGQESQFGRPEEMLTPEHLSELFQVEEGRFRQTGGSMELPRPEGAPEVFVLAGGGSGRAVFWQLQRAGTTFAAGIVSEADLDYPAACTLASRLIAVPAFEEISEEKEQEARECLDACQCVIACRRQYGGWAAANDRLLAYAREKGKKIEYHNLPLHKMQ